MRLAIPDPRILSILYLFFRSDGTVSTPFLKCDSFRNSSVSRLRSSSARSFVLSDVFSVLLFFCALTPHSSLCGHCAQTLFSAHPIPIMRIIRYHMMPPLKDSSHRPIPSYNFGYIIFLLISNKINDTMLALIRMCSWLREAIIAVNRHTHAFYLKIWRN